MILQPSIGSYFAAGNSALNEHRKLKTSLLFRAIFDLFKPFGQCRQQFPKKSGLIG
jgi:hypothetical protein